MGKNSSNFSFYHILHMQTHTHCYTLLRYVSQINITDSYILSLHIGRPLYANQKGSNRLQIGMQL